MSAPCVVCDSPPVQPCVRCKSTLDHRHLAMLGRDGQVVAETVMCVPCVGTFYIHGRPLTDAMDYVAVRSR